MVVLPCMCSGFPTKIMEQTIVTSLYDVTRFSCVTEGGNYKRRAKPSLRLLAAAITSYLGVSTQVFGSLLSHRPSTSAVSVPLE